MRYFHRILIFGMKVQELNILECRFESQLFFRIVLFKASLQSDS